ncbi:MAG: serine--tRNA ligase [Rhizobiaceae bacterium]|nr:serine--tRNA ligase [Rhizobiaceae bacterium]
MFDIKWIREKPKAFDEAMNLRGLPPQAESLVQLDDNRRAHISKLQEAQEERNRASKEIGKAKGAGDEEAAQKAIAEVAKLKSFLQTGEEEGKTLSKAVSDALSVLPNIPYEDVPVGEDEDDNVEIRLVGDKPVLDFDPKEHFELGEALGQMDFDTAAKLSGSRFVLLNNGLARLERALGQFMLDLHTTEHGYAEVSPPVLVREEVLYGVGNLPKFEEDLFKTTDGRWMIPTSEAPLTNIVREEIVPADYLPRRYTALTNCFRAEAGSAGRDTRGMLRQHQFSKVELVSITDAESSNAEHERMLSCAEEVLKQLGLHYRVVTLCTGDLGFSAHKTYDIEVWLPGQNAYREISSCSVCGDFQARRMNARYRVEGDKQLRYCHTLNGSGIAVGRALIAVMENFQNQDGSIRVPQVLGRYMGGITRIESN